MDSLSKRLEEARRAFGRNDKPASARAHDPTCIAEAAEEHGETGSQYLGEMVYGGLAVGAAYAVGALLKGIGG